MTFPLRELIVAAILIVNLTNSISTIISNELDLTNHKMNCDNDGICDPDEECATCNDCIIDLSTYLLAKFSFSGNASDDSGNGHDGTVSGAILVSDRFGSINSAYYFDGSNDFISLLGDNSAFEVQNFTITSWVQWEDGAACCGGGGIVSVTSSDDITDHYAMTCHETLVRSWVNYPVSSPNDLFQLDTTALSDGQWHQVTATYDGSTRELFIDGELVKEGALAEAIIFGSGTKVVIGVDLPGGDDYFKGSIDDIRIYSRALSHCEIQSLYEVECPELFAIENQTFTSDTTFIASQILRIENVSIVSPFELTLRAPEVVIENESLIPINARLNVINENGCP